MNQPLVDQIARTVLYEGYLLYPYRPSSVKNRHRWTFGGIYPRAFSNRHAETDPCTMQTQCVVWGSPAAEIRITVRFLHLLARTVEQADADHAFSPVESLEVGARSYQTWQEAVERTVELQPFPLGVLLSAPRSMPFAFPGSHEVQPLAHGDGRIAGRVIREQQPINGTIELRAERRQESAAVLAVCISNETTMEDADAGCRDAALLRSLVSTHTVLQIEGGEFVSLTDPPLAFQEMAAECRNVGCWPVLVGRQGEHGTLLSSPIILGDYPEVAPESPGDLFDATEIDEILTLRILTLTEQEKQQAAATDERAARMLARTEALARQQLLDLHGTIRGLRPLPAQHAIPAEHRDE